MNITRIILTVALAGTALSPKAQVSASPERFSPLASGYLERARAMNDAGNFAGVIDQLRQLDTRMDVLSQKEREEYSFLLAKAYYGRDDAECLRLLMEFADTYPASQLAPEARLLIGDFYFFRHEWPQALDMYSITDTDRLNRDQQLLYTYRKALSMIKTGHFKEARPLINTLKNATGYENSYLFYTAYLDYIDGDFTKAYGLFSRVPKGIPGLDTDYYMTQIEYSRGDFNDAIMRGSSLLRSNPDPELAPEINRVVGLAYFKTGRAEDARPYLDKYLHAAEDSPAPDALYALGAIDYEDGDYEAAVAKFSQICNMPDALGQGAWLYLGQCYLRQDNTSSAAMAFDKAWRLGYDRNVSENALYNYVTSLTRGGKVPFTSSSEMLEKFVELYPESEFTPDVEAYLATAYYNDRNYPKALACIDAIRNPSATVLATRQKVLYELGIESATNGRSENAVKYLKECVALGKYDSNLAAQASLWLGDALFSLGNFREARKAYETFIRDDASRENRALGLYDLAYAKYKLKDYAGAAGDFASALSARPALPTRLIDDARIRRADCLYYTGKYSEAASLYSAAIENDATDSDYALYRRAVISGLNGNTKSKLSDLTRIEREYPSSRWLSKALLEEAVTYEETGHKDLAADAYKKRLGLTADVDIDELLRMAAAMHSAGRSADLLDVTERIHHAGGLEADELAEINLYEAVALRNLGRTEEALTIYTDLAHNPSSLPGSEAAVSIAEILIKEGKYEDARDRMEEFTDTGTPHNYWLARGFIALADAYKALGNKTLAREYMVSLNENYPGDEADIKSMISSRLKKWK